MSGGGGVPSLTVSRDVLWCPHPHPPRMTASPSRPALPRPKTPGGPRRRAAPRSPPAQASVSGGVWAGFLRLEARGHRAGSPARECAPSCPSAAPQAAHPDPAPRHPPLAYWDIGELPGRPLLRLLGGAGTLAAPKSLYRELPGAGSRHPDPSPRLRAAARSGGRGQRVKHKGAEWKAGGRAEKGTGTPD